MTQFTQLSKKGMDGFWIESSLAEDKLSLHISEIAAGTRAHPPHTHSGVEAFYILAGNGTVELADGSTIAVGPNQAVTVDATRMHGLVNTGSTPLKYIVVIAKP
jgi:mannose-6-phosphate isomerase-like protein (cupin superfamily)